MLQFITNTECGVPVTDQIFAVIDGGCRWIQIRMKDASDEEIGKVVEAVKPRCIETESFLLLDSRVELAKALDVGGVLLGKDNMPCSKARTILGPAAVIGITANTFEEISAIRALDVDYIALAPFAESCGETEPAPALGTEGIRVICEKMEKEKINIPRVALGGIRPEDIEPLIKAGVNGIASSAMAYTPDIAEATRHILTMS